MNEKLNNHLHETLCRDELNQKLFGYIRENTPDVELYLVGGYIRDLILGETTYDQDYVVMGMSAIEFAKNFANYINGYYVLLDDTYDIARVVLEDKKTTLDFSLCIGETLEDDLSRRDLTINAMAYKLDLTESQQLIDPFQGRLDLDKKQVKFIREQNVIDDPLRVMRAPRFAAQLNTSLPDETIELIKKHYEKLHSVAFERITMELNKLFILPNSFDYVQLLLDIGILEYLMPEMTDLRKVPPNVYHHLGLMEHSLEVYKQTEKLIETVKQPTYDHLRVLLNQNCPRLLALKYAALLHDIAKPATWKIDNEGKHTFIDHPAQGAPIAAEITKRLKNPRSIVKIVEKLVKYHLYPSQLSQNNEIPTDKAKNRFFRKLERETPEAVLLAIADRNAAQGPLITDEILKTSIDTLWNLLESYYTYQTQEETIPRLLNGKDIMALLSIPPSKKVGKILEQLREHQLEGRLNTADEAKSWVLQTFSS